MTCTTSWFDCNNHLEPALYNTYNLVAYGGTHPIACVTIYVNNLLVIVYLGFAWWEPMRQVVKTQEALANGHLL